MKPTVAPEAKTISVSVDRTLLDRADAYAKRAGMTRGELVARGLKLAMKNGAKASR